MNRPVLLLLLVGFLIAADAPPEDAKALELAIRTLNDAYMKQDAETIKQLTGDDLVVVTSSGKREGRAEQLKSLSDLKISEYRTETVRMSMPAKDVAIVTFQSSLKGTFKGKPIPEKVAVATVWVNRGGKWVEVFYQATPLDSK